MCVVLLRLLVFAYVVSIVEEGLVDGVAKVYSAPLKLEETPLTLAINLSARFGCQVSHC